MFCVLRLPHFEHVLAVVDAAQQSGWKFVEDKSVKIDSCDEQYPGLCFEANDSETLDEDQVLSFWIQKDPGVQVISQAFRNNCAVAIFKSLGNKKILKSKEKNYDCGNTAESIVGVSGALGFCFFRATTGLTNIKLMTASEARKFDPIFDWPEEMFGPMESVKISSRTKKRRKGKKR